MIILSFGLIHDRTGQNIISMYHGLLKNYGYLSKSNHVKIPIKIENALDTLMVSWIKWVGYVKV